MILHHIHIIIIYFFDKLKQALCSVYECILLCYFNILYFIMLSTRLLVGDKGNIGIVFLVILQMWMSVSCISTIALKYASIWSPTSRVNVQMVLTWRMISKRAMVTNCYLHNLLNFKHYVFLKW